MSRKPLRPTHVAASTLALLLAGVGALTVPGQVSAAPAGSEAPQVTLERPADEIPEIIEIEVPDTAELDRLVATGVDLDHGVHQDEHGLHVRAVVTPTEAATLADLGFDLGQVLSSEEEMNAALVERQATLAENLGEAKAFAAAASDSTNPDVSDVRIVRADYYTNFGSPFLSVEAKWAFGQDQAGLPANQRTTLTVERDSGPGTELGSGGTQVLTSFVDAGAYLYHRGASAVPTGDGDEPVRPHRVRITSESGDVAIVEVTDWLPIDGDDPFKGDGYLEDFVASYLTPTELYDRIQQLADEFPELAEIVELPHETNGYRRKAQALLDPPGPRLALADGTDATYVAASYGPQVAAGGTPAADAPVETVASGPNAEFPAATPEMGCGEIAPLTPGAVALVDRGECPFAEKTLNAQEAGAAAVVIVNNVAGAPTAPGGEALPGTLVPTVMISMADGAAIREAADPTGRLLPGAAINNAARVGVDSVAWGHEGGNDLTVQVVDPGTPDAPLAVTVTGDHVEVSAATDGSGALTSTAAQVVAAINAHPGADELLTAYTYRGNAGGAVVPATRVIELSDNLSAPESVSRDPHQVYALRLGKHRDGSRLGVLAYAQEHAREWVPPLVTIETAERLLRNYENHEATRDLLDNLDVWIAPSINPDGGHYSFHDFASQRRNMVRYCEPTGNFDAGARNTWGVDLNRNYDEYSMFDGYSGASASCTSDTFAGPAELSEPEARNLDWIAAHDNIKFSMNLHSSGNYFMWSPGSYQTPGRIPAPRPTVEEEAFFWGASSRILTEIKRHRGMSVTPARTGPTSDVLYSAAGNSGDMLWYKYGIYAWNFEVGTTFQPPFSSENPAGASAHAETMEYANGLVEMMRVARDFDTDDVAPHSAVEISESSTDGMVGLRFTTNEPAAVFYTLDGTVPNLGSTMYASAGVREGGELLTVPRGATIHWFAVDSAGNVERGYVPGHEGNYRSWTAEIGWEPPLGASTVALQLDRTRVAVGQAGPRATVRVTPAAAGDAAPASGVVDVMAKGVRLGSATLGADGSAVLDLGRFDRAGGTVLTAVYSGDDNLAGATSTPVALTVARATARIKAKVTPKRVRTTGPRKRTRARLVVQVRVPGMAPRGTVVVRRGGTVLASGTVNAKGRVALRLKRFPKPGRKKLNVVLLGSRDVKRANVRVNLRVRR